MNPGIAVCFFFKTSLNVYCACDILHHLIFLAREAIEHEGGVISQLYHFNRLYIFAFAIQLQYRSAVFPHLKLCRCLLFHLSAPFLCSFLLPSWCPCHLIAALLCFTLKTLKGSWKCLIQRQKSFCSSSWWSACYKSIKMLLINEVWNWFGSHKKQMPTFLQRKASLPSKSRALKIEVLIIQRKILETVSGDYPIPNADVVPPQW